MHWYGSGRLVRDLCIFWPPQTSLVGKIPCLFNLPSTGLEWLTLPLLCPPCKGPVSDFTRDASVSANQHTLCMHPLKKQCICLSIYQSPVLYATQSHYMYYFCSDFFHGVRGIPRCFCFCQFGGNSLWF